MLQTVVCRRSPLHEEPPHLGRTAYDLVRTEVPPPHVAEQELQLPQFSNRQLTGQHPELQSLVCSLMPLQEKPPHLGFTACALFRVETPIPQVTEQELQLPHPLH